MQTCMRYDLTKWRHQLQEIPPSSRGLISRSAKLLDVAKGKAVSVYSDAIESCSVGHRKVPNNFRPGQFVTGLRVVVGNYE